MLRSTLIVTQFGRTKFKLHWSWPLGLLALAGLLSPLYLELGDGLAVLLGLLSALLIYGSVLLHELAHAAAGHSVGLPVKAVTLYGVGGQTELDDQECGPLAELLIAFAGPLVSTALTLIWFLTLLALTPGPTRMLAMVLMVINGVLLIMNLLPSYPLDGGRIVKAALWYLLDDEIPAARLATLIGRACGWALLAIGVIVVLVADNLAYGMIFGLAGYFLSRTSIDGFRQLTIRRALHGVRAEEIMLRAFRAIGPDLPLDQFVGRCVLGQGEQQFPVVAHPDAGGPQLLLGMMTLRDLRRFTLSEWTLTRVHEAMTPASRVLALAPETTADVALRMLNESGADLLPVVADHALLGVVRRRDLLYHLRRRIEKA